jgi:hypothetical protein
MCLPANNSNVPTEVFSLCDINIKDITENNSTLVGRAARPRRAHEVLSIGSKSSGPRRGTTSPRAPAPTP